MTNLAPAVEAALNAVESAAIAFAAARSDTAFTHLEQRKAALLALIRSAIAVPDEMVLTDYRGGYGINTKHGFQRGTKFVEATRDEANGWNACRAAMLGDKA